MNAQYYITHLRLEPHPEGGYFKETYRCAENIPAGAIPTRFSGFRSFSTSIYYLLERGDFSAFHRIKSDECWHFYAGQTLLIQIIGEDGIYSCIPLGSDIEAGETFQFTVPAGAWFAVEPKSNCEFALAGCTVSPGFDFADFEMADKEMMLATFPEHREIISRLCR